MAKKVLKPSAVLFPLPTVLVSCKNEAGRSSIITISFIAIVNSDPPMIGMAIRPNRYSHGIIKDSNEFVVNIPSEKLLKQADYCGVVSGKDMDKFGAAKFTPVVSEKVKAPSIAECAVHLECVVRQIVPLRSHDFFIGEIVTLRADEEVLQPDRSSLDISKILPFAYCQGALQYWSLKEPIGTYGFTKGKI